MHLLMGRARLAQGELAMTAGHLGMAQQCLVKAKDFSGLLLMRRCVRASVCLLGEEGECLARAA